MEAAERERLSAINSELAVQLVAQQQQVLSLEAAAAALAADAEAARSSADMVASQLEAAASWQRHASEENKKLRQSRSPSPGLASASLLEAKSAEAAAMQAALDEVRANAAAARAALEAAESRNAVLDKAHAKAAAEALQLATEKRQLAAALKSARSQAAALGGQLEAARALAPQLQAARAAAADTAALLASAHSRSSVLEKAWAAATKVDGCTPAGCWWVGVRRCKPGRQLVAGDCRPGEWRLTYPLSPSHTTRRTPRRSRAHAARRRRSWSGRARSWRAWPPTWTIQRWVVDGCACAGAAGRRALHAGQGDLGRARARVSFAAPCAWALVR